jgi:DNA-binding MarR family transcriptional regulator
VSAARVPAKSAMSAQPGSAPERVGLRYLAVGYWVEKMLDDQMTASGLSLARWKVLAVLEGSGSIRQKSLADGLGYAERTVTQAVESLARDGLIARTADPVDRRAKLVTLTDEGAAALTAGTKAGERVLRRIFGALDDRQRTTLGELLDLIDDAGPRH